MNYFFVASLMPVDLFLKYDKNSEVVHLTQEFISSNINGTCPVWPETNQIKIH